MVPGGKWQTVIVQAGLGGQGGEFGLPGAGAVAVGAARVRGDQQPCGVRVVGAGPTACHQRRIEVDRERGGVVVGADADPAGVRGHVVDPVGDGLAQLLPVEEVVRLDLHRDHLPAATHGRRS